MAEDVVTKQRELNGGVANPQQQSPAALSPAKVKEEKDMLTSFDSDDEEVQEVNIISESQVEKELQAFQGERNANGMDAVEWWHANGVAYPVLSMVARQNMCVRATSAKAEHDFSVAGLVSSKLRQRLAPYTLQMCTFCSQNQQFVDKVAPSNFRG